MMNNPDDKIRDEAHAEADTRYPWLLTGLLAMIAVALAGLWLVERGRRLRAEAEWLEEHRRNEASMRLVGQMLAQEEHSPKWDRRRLATREVVWDGQPRTVLLLPAPDGEALGLQPGDAILVTPPPQAPPETATQPAHAPDRK